MSENKPPSRQQLITTPSLLPKIINGGIACIIGISIVFPLDTVKTRLQNQTVGPKGEKQYKNILDCFRQTIASEGYFGMYRGSAINILLVTPEKGVKLAANDILRYYLTRQDGSLPIFRQMIAAGIAGAFQVTITTPMELIKINMQDQGRLALQAKKEGKVFSRTSTLESVRRVLVKRGPLGLYRGVSATAARDVTFSVVHFPLFAAIGAMGINEEGQIPFWWSFISGVTSSALAAILVTPMDVMKTRMQGSTNEKQYSSVFDCARQTMQKEGPRAFFKGGACRCMVLAPLYGIAQTVYYLGIAEYFLGYK